MEMSLVLGGWAGQKGHCYIRDVGGWTLDSPFRKLRISEGRAWSCILNNSGGHHESMESLETSGSAQP